MSTAIRESAECLPSEGVSFRESARNFRTLFETMASAIFNHRERPGTSHE
jgi:hypothetical protein